MKFAARDCPVCGLAQNNWFNHFKKVHGGLDLKYNKLEYIAQWELIKGYCTPKTTPADLRQMKGAIKNEVDLDKYKKLYKRVVTNRGTEIPIRESGNVDDLWFQPWQGFIWMHVSLSSKLKNFYKDGMATLETMKREQSRKIIFICDGTGTSGKSTMMRILAQNSENVIDLSQEAPKDMLVALKKRAAECDTRFPLSVLINMAKNVSTAQLLGMSGLLEKIKDQQTDNSKNIIGKFPKINCMVAANLTPNNLINGINITEDRFSIYNLINRGESIEHYEVTKHHTHLEVDGKTYSRDFLKTLISMDLNLIDYLFRNMITMSECLNDHTTSQLPIPKNWEETLENGASTSKHTIICSDSELEDPPVEDPPIESPTTKKMSVKTKKSKSVSKKNKTASPSEFKSPEFVIDDESDDESPKAPKSKKDSRSKYHKNGKKRSSKKKNKSSKKSLRDKKTPKSEDVEIVDVVAPQFLESPVRHAKKREIKYASKDAQLTGIYTHFDPPKNNSNDYVTIKSPAGGLTFPKPAGVRQMLTFMSRKNNEVRACCASTADTYAIHQATDQKLQLLPSGNTPEELDDVMSGRSQATDYFNASVESPGTASNSSDVQSKVETPVKMTESEKSNESGVEGSGDGELVSENQCDSGVERVADNMSDNEEGSGPQAIEDLDFSGIEDLDISAIEGSDSQAAADLDFSAIEDLDISAIEGSDPQIIEGSENNECVTVGYNCEVQQSECASETGDSGSEASDSEMEGEEGSEDEEEIAIRESRMRELNERKARTEKKIVKILTDDEMMERMEPEIDISEPTHDESEEAVANIPGVRSQQPGIGHKKIRISSERAESKSSPMRAPSAKKRPRSAMSQGGTPTRPEEEWEFASVCKRPKVEPKMSGTVPMSEDQYRN